MEPPINSVLPPDKDKNSLLFKSQTQLTQLSTANTASTINLNTSSRNQITTLTSSVAAISTASATSSACGVSGVGGAAIGGVNTGVPTTTTVQQTIDKLSRPMAFDKVCK